MLTFIGDPDRGLWSLRGVARYIIKGYSATGVLFVGGFNLTDRQRPAGT